MQDLATKIMKKLLTSNETGWVYISPAALRTLVESLQHGGDALLRIRYPMKMHPYGHSLTLNKLKIDLEIFDLCT